MGYDVGDSFSLDFELDRIRSYSEWYIYRDDIYSIQFERKWKYIFWSLQSVAQVSNKKPVKGFFFYSGMHYSDFRSLEISLLISDFRSPEISLLFSDFMSHEISPLFSGFRSPEISLLFFDWLGNKRIFTWCQIIQKMVITIWFRFDIIRFWKYFSVRSSIPRKIIQDRGIQLWSIDWCTFFYENGSLSL